MPNFTEYKACSTHQWQSSSLACLLGSPRGIAYTTLCKQFARFGREEIRAYTCTCTGRDGLFNNKRLLSYRTAQSEGRTFSPRLADDSQVSASHKFDIRNCIVLWLQDACDWSVLNHCWTIDNEHSFILYNRQGSKMWFSRLPIIKNEVILS